MTQERKSCPGRCTCGTIQYEMTAAPLFVHCCHCTWCQRETGSAFALNAMIETSEVRVLKGEPERVKTDSNSGKGQDYFRCPECRIALWSIYCGAGEKILFVRVGTLEDAVKPEPDIHIFTESKLPWVIIPEGQHVVERYYNRNKFWPASSLERFQRLLDPL